MSVDPPPPPPTEVVPEQGRWWRRITRDPQRARLDEEIQIAQLRLQNLRAGLGAHDRSAHELANRVSQALVGAKRDLDRLDVDTGFAHLHFAYELEFGLLPAIELDARSVELRAESTAGKYGGWRGTAIIALLDRSTTVGLDHRRQLVGQAARIAMTASSNGYRKLTILRRHQTILLLIATALLVLAAGFTVFNTDHFDEVGHWWVAVVAILLGGLGGVTSALQRSTQPAAPGTIPERLTSYVVSLSRPLLGGVAGFLAYLGQRVVIDTDGAAKVGAILVASFAAGFAERLLPASGADTGAPPPGAPASPPAPPSAPLDEPVTSGPA
ncbi:MAG: hypothetical protein RJA49_2661, partial [Actinomycetota bacterium]